MGNPGNYPQLASTLVRLLVLALLWWLISEGNPDLWWGGLVALALAWWAGRQLQPRAWRWPRWRRLPAFLLFFVRQSLTAGTLVASRAFRADPGFSPSLIHYPCQLPPGPRELLMAIISLMPGTLVAGVAANQLLIHALDGDANVDGLVAAERQVALLFGLSLPEVRHGQ